MQLTQWTHIGTGNFGFIDMAARADHRCIYNDFATQATFAHNHGMLDLGKGMHFDAALHRAVFQDDTVIDFGGFFEGTQQNRVAQFGGSVDPGVRSNPAVADNVGVAHHGTTSNKAQALLHFQGPGFHLLRKGFLQSFVLAQE